MSRARWTFVAMAVVAVLVGAWTVRQALSARTDLLAARSELETAETAIRDADLDTASAALERATSELESANGRLGSPVLRLAGAVPLLGNSVDVARAIGSGTALITEAATTTVEALETAEQEVTDDDEPGLPVDVLVRLRDPVEATRDALQRAVQQVSRSPGSFLIGSVADARQDFLELARPLSRDASQGTELLSALPTFLGADEPRTYYFGVSNPAEARGTGGYVGAYSRLTIDDGRLEFGPFGATEDLAPVDVDALPIPEPDLLDRYGRFGFPGSWSNANLTADFPTAASTFEALWAEEFGDELDGSIVVDPFAFAALVEVSGPVEVPGIGTLEAEDIVPFVTNEAYAEIEDNLERKRVLGEVAAGALRRFLSDLDTGDLQSTMDVLSELVGARRILLHASDPDIQEVFADLGLDGRLQSPDGDLLLLTTNSGTANKLDFYTERSLHHRVELREDGFAETRLVATFEHDAPTSGLPSRVIGPNVVGLDAGENRLFVSAYCDVGCEFTETAEGESDLRSPDDVQRELGHPVHSTWIDLPSDSSQTLEWSWFTPDAWFFEDGELVYRLTYQHHPQVNPTDLTVEVVVPPGYEPVEIPDGARVADGAVRLTSETSADQVLTYRFRAR